MLRFLILEEALGTEKREKWAFLGVSVSAMSELFMDTHVDTHCKSFGRFLELNGVTCVICLYEMVAKRHYGT